MNSQSEPDPDSSSEESRSPMAWRSFKDSVDLIAVSQVGLFVLALVYSLHKAKPLLLPVVLATLVALVVQPINRLLRKAHVPKLLSAAIVVSALVGLLSFVIYHAALPGAQWAKQVDYETVSSRVQEVFRPVKEVQANIKEVADRVEEATRAEPVEEKKEEGKTNGLEQPKEDSEDGDEELPEAHLEKPVTLIPVSTAGATGSQPKEKGEEKEGPRAAPVVVEIREDPVGLLMTKAQDFGLGLAAFLILVLFMLAYGNRIVRSLSENEATATVLERVGTDVSHYMFTITVINAGLGLVIGCAMWLLGMPNPALWGVAAMFLNYIPYIGALMGSGLVFLVAAASFDTPAAVIPIPITYFVLTAIEGNLITPVVLGGRFRLNPLVVFIWVFAWGSFWGIAGVLIAMPMLVIFKIFCENTATMERFRRLMAA